VEVTLENPTDLPRDLPATWLNPEQSSVLVRFTDSQFDAERNKAEIRRRFDGVRDISARSISLRAVVVALAKSARQRR
jgi:hypothetical protein